MQKASDIFGGAAGGPVLWEAGKNYKRGQIVISPTDWQPYARHAAEGSGADDPATDPAHYTPSGGRPIKSVQRGVASYTYNSHSGGQPVHITIAPVNPAKTIVHHLGAITSNAHYTGTLELIAPTTLRLKGGNQGAITVAFEVVEYY